MSDVGLDIDDLNPTQQDEVRQACQSPACVDATAAVVTARNDFIVKCDELMSLVRRRDSLMIAAATMAALAIAIVVVGSVLVVSPEPVTSFVGTAFLVIGLAVCRT